MVCGGVGGGGPSGRLILQLCFKSPLPPILPPLPKLHEQQETSAQEDVVAGISGMLQGAPDTPGSGVHSMHCVHQ